MTTDRWIENRTESVDFDEVTWSDVEKAIDRLDARVYTEVHVALSEDSHIAIGGGASRYVVEITSWDDTDQEHIFTLENAQPGTSVEELTIGGQRSNFTSQIVVSKEMALQAARFYYDRGLPDPSLTWQVQ